MVYEFKLPDIGEGLTEGEVTKWHVKEGDSVKENQPLCSVLTDKAEVEIPSPKAGTVTKLFAKPGEKVKVHAPLVAFELANGSSAKAAPAPIRPGADKPAPVPAPSQTAAPTGKGNFDFMLPDIGEGLTEGEVTRWHVKEGDVVKENQPLCNVLTDKAEVEVPSPKSGKIVKLYAKAGEKVKVHAPLVGFELAGGASSKTPVAKSAPQASTPTTTSRASAPSQNVSATPMVRQLAKTMGVDISLVAGTGPQGRVLEADVKNFKGGTATSLPSGPVNATPAVQQLAAQLGVNLAGTQGTGPGGRIAEWDVRARAAARPPGAPASPPSASRSEQHQLQPLPVLPGETRTPFVGIRRKIAEKMHQSLSTAATVTHMDECDMTALVKLREEMKKEAEKKKVKLTYLPFIIRALAKTLKEYPNFNSSLDDAKGELVVKSYQNIGIAVSAGQGLIVPNIKKADEKDVWGLAAEVQTLAEKVRSGKIDVPSLQGGTFTITNIGPIGGLFATPIINHPEVAILGLLKLQKRPVVRNDKLEIRDMMNLVLSFDHRVVDGADAANFMNTLLKYLENPRTIL
jgi:pyruvate dehydrogenase E2 component (dihydrolipoamide acetyltransferase)